MVQFRKEQVDYTGDTELNTNFLKKALKRGIFFLTRESSVCKIYGTS